MSGIKPLEISEYEHRPYFDKLDLLQLIDKCYYELKTPLDDFFKVSIKVVEGLRHIHKQGVIHKDINPRNIM